ncbi:MAG TPA: DNA translocase FtsK 4TM domain-containing protein, partial [Candidatus Paceibacterota bacterium]
MASNGTRKSDRERNGKSKKKEQKENDAPVRRTISAEATRGVAAIFFVAIAGFLLLAQIGAGGAVGASIYNLLSALLGVGYLLLPLSFVFLAVIIFQSFEKKFGLIQIVSVCVFLLSSLGLINLAFPGRGGVVGDLVSRPLVAGLETAATAIFLSAFTICSLIIAFDVHVIELFRNLYARMRGAEERGADD